jgi:hypothetical protein
VPVVGTDHASCRLPGASNSVVGGMSAEESGPDNASIMTLGNSARIVRFADLCGTGRSRQDYR